MLTAKNKLLTQKAFTIIELMVVISIMAILSVVVFVNLRSFGEDANLKNVAFDVQSYIRLAQTNATSGVRCGGHGGASWSIVISGRNTVNLVCETQDAYVRTWTIHSPALISSICGSGGCASCPSSFTAGDAVISKLIKVTFSYLEGKVSFEDEDSTQQCFLQTSDMVINLIKKSESEDTKSVTINKGGSIDIN